MKLQFSILLILFSVKLFSQDNQAIVTENKAKSYQYAANEFVGLYEDKRARYDQQQRTDKLTDLKNFYRSYGTYPDSIVRGWHEVVVMNDSKFFGAAKVYVSNNAIQKFVVDNCIQLDFTASKLTRGKATVTLKKVADVPLQTFDVYFMDDLDKPTTFDEPVEPGYICFWTRSKKSLDWEIIIDGKRIEKVSIMLKNPPECFAAGTSTIAMKPGVYKVEMLKRGNNVDIVAKVQAGTCTYYELE